MNLPIFRHGQLVHLIGYAREHTLPRMCDNLTVIWIFRKYGSRRGGVVVVNNQDFVLTYSPVELAAGPEPLEKP